jgi:hypothetical protein
MRSGSCAEQRVKHVTFYLRLSKVLYGWIGAVGMARASRPEAWHARTTCELAAMDASRRRPIGMLPYTYHRFRLFFTASFLVILPFDWLRR